MARRDDEAVRRSVEHLARTFADWGFPRMAARVIMTMMTAEEESLTAGELSDRLGVSPAAISGAVRYLTQIGMVVREPVAGSRRDRYRLVDEAWYELTVTRMTIFRSIAELAGDGVSAVGGAGTVAGARLAGMREYFRYVEREMPGLLDRWRAARPHRPGSRGRPPARGH